MAPVHLEPRHKRDFMVSGNNRGQKRYLLASPQYASVPDPRQNEENDRGKNRSEWHLIKENKYHFVKTI